MTDLLISLIKIKDRYFPVYQAVDRHPYVRPVRQCKTRRSDRIDHRSLLTDEEMARANSLPMPIGIGLGAGMGVAVNITETGAFRRNALGLDIASHENGSN
jgi:hypothetical protein